MPPNPKPLTFHPSLLVTFGWLGVACGGVYHRDEPATSGGAGSDSAVNGGSNATTAGTAPTTDGGTGLGGVSGGSSGSATGGALAMGGRPDAAGGAGGDITSVWPSFGCGKDYTGLIGQKITLGTSGMKAANCTAKTVDGTKKCGPWGQASSTWQKAPLPRDYWVYLPANYDPTKQYPLVIQGPGCSGTGGGIYSLPGAKDNAIRIGISPPDRSVGHATNPGQGCFDDKEGDDSLDFVFYETLYDELNDALCFDRNRVFAVGDSSGASLANELGCKYAGDMHGRPIRGVVSKSGLLPTEAEYAPTCTTQPMAGLWLYNADDFGTPAPQPNDAVGRAMKVNGCMGAVDMNDAIAKGLVVSFPIGGGNADNVCKLIQGCSELYPLVVCPLPPQHQQSFNYVVEAAGSTFLNMFLKAPFKSTMSGAP